MPFARQSRAPAGETPRSWPPPPWSKRIGGPCSRQNRLPPPVRSPTAAHRGSDTCGRCIPTLRGHFHPGVPRRFLAESWRCLVGHLLPPSLENTSRFDGSIRHSSRDAALLLQPDTTTFPKEAEGITSRNFLTRRGHPASLSRNPSALTIHLAWSEARLVSILQIHGSIIAAKEFPSNEAACILSRSVTPENQQDINHERLRTTEGRANRTAV